MAATITSVGNGTATDTTSTISTGATVTADVGDWLVVFGACDNSQSSGAGPQFPTSAITGIETNSYTERADLSYDPGAASAGASLGIFTIEVTDALSNVTLTLNCSVTSQRCIEVYRIQPGAGETISFVAVDATGSGSNETTHVANTVSVTSGDIIFGAAAIETDDTITGDSDTTNGSWSTVSTRLADGGADASTMSLVTQHKTVTATGDQSWECTTSSGRDSMRSYIVLRSASSVQDLTPGLMSNTQTFFAPIVAGPLIPGLQQNTQEFFAPTVLATYSLTAGLQQNSQQFFAPTVLSTYPLTPGLQLNTQEFFAPAVTATYTLTPGLQQNTQEFFAPTVLSTYALTPGLFSNAQQFFAPTVAATYALTPGLQLNTQEFFAPTVAGEGGDQALTPGLFSNSQTFNAPLVEATYALTPSLYSNSQTFPAPTVTATYDLAPALMTNSQTFPAPTVTPGAVDIAPSLYQNTQSFPAPTVLSTYSLTPALFTNAQAFPAPTISATNDIAPPLYQNAQVFFSPTVVGGAAADQGGGEFERRRRRM